LAAVRAFAAAHRVVFVFREFAAVYAFAARHVCASRRNVISAQRKILEIVVFAALGARAVRNIVARRIAFVPRVCAAFDATTATTLILRYILAAYGKTAFAYSGTDIRNGYVRVDDDRT